MEKTYSNIQHLAFNNDSPNIGNNKIQPQATIVFMIMEQIFNKEQQEKCAIHFESSFSQTIGFALK